MFLLPRRRACLLALAVLLLAPTSLLAKKPGGGGNDPPPPPPGTLYFGPGDIGDTIWRCKADGSQAAHEIDPPDDAAGGAPTSLLYGEPGNAHRWWVVQQIARDENGQPRTYTLFNIEGSAPQERNVYEVFAARRIQVDGAWAVQVVQLTDSFGAMLLTGGGGRWSNDGLDSFLSFTGYEIAPGGYDPLTSSVDRMALSSRRLYRLHITGSDISPGFVPLDPELDVLAFEPIMDVIEAGRTLIDYDWSPAGDQILMTRWNNGTTGEPRGYDTAVVTLGETISEEVIFTSASEPHGRWSPDGERLVIGSAGDIAVVPVPGGSGAAGNLFGSSKKGYYKTPQWSPDGQHLLLVHYVWSNRDWDYAYKVGVWKVGDETPTVFSVPFVYAHLHANSWRADLHVNDLQ